MKIPTRCVPATSKCFTWGNTPERSWPRMTLQQLKRAMRDGLTPQQFAIYVLGEIVGGFPKQWHVLEQDKGLCGQYSRMLIALKKAIRGHDLLFSTAHQLFESAIAKYGLANQTSSTYPIEGDGDAYYYNDHKWEGKWLARRRRFAEQLAGYFQSGNELELQQCYWAPLPLDFDSPLELAVSVLKFMHNVDYIPWDDRRGVCSNFMFILDQELGDERTLRNQASQWFKNGMDMFTEARQPLHTSYPIEGTYKAYVLNEHKWEGDWLAQRRELMVYLINNMKNTRTVDDDTN